MSKRLAYYCGIAMNYIDDNIDIGKVIKLMDLINKINKPGRVVKACSLLIWKSPS